MPLNAALTAGFSHDEVFFELSEVESGEEIALLEPTCDRTVCTARPVADLAPNTTYRYRVTQRWEGQSDWIAFSTGDAVDVSLPEPAQVTVSLTAAGPAEPPSTEGHPCGYFRRATLDIAALEIDAPLAFVVPGVVPTFFTAPVLLTEPGTSTLEITGTPACFTPWLVDISGDRSELEEICLPQLGLDSNTAESGGSGGAGSEVLTSSGAGHTPAGSGGAAAVGIAGSAVVEVEADGSAETESVDSRNVVACGFNPHRRTRASAILLGMLGASAAFWQRSRRRRAAPLEAR